MRLLCGEKEALLQDGAGPREAFLRGARAAGGTGRGEPWVLRCPGRGRGAEAAAAAPGCGGSAAWTGPSTEDSVGESYGQQLSGNAAIQLKV